MAFITDLGIESAVLINGVDVSELLNKAELTNPQDAVKVTRFDPRKLRRRAQQYIAGLSSSTLSTTGFSSAKLADVEALLKQALTPGSGPDDVLVGVGGFTPGNLAFAVKSILTKQTGPNVMPDGAIAVGADYQGTASSPGLRAGKALWTPHGSGVIAQDTKFTIVAGAARGNATVTFYDNTGTIVGTVTVTPGMSTSALAAAIAALPYYTAASVTGSTSAFTQIANPTLIASNTNGSGSYPIGYYQFVYTYIDSHGETLKTSTPYLAQLVGTASFAFTAPTLPSGATGTKWYGTKHQVDAGAAAAATYYLLGSSADNTFSSTTEPVGSEAQPPVSNTTGADATGTYTLDITGPGNVDIPQPTTASSGWATHKTIIGEDITGVNKITGTGPGTAVSDIDTSATTASGGLAVVQVVDFDGATPSVTVTIEHAVDSGGSPGSWVTLGTFDAMTAPGVQRLAIAPGTTINPHVRLNVTALSGDVAFAGAWFRYPD